MKAILLAVLGGAAIMAVIKLGGRLLYQGNVGGFLALVIVIIAVPVGLWIWDRRRKIQSELEDLAARGLVASRDVQKRAGEQAQSLGERITARAAEIEKQRSAPQSPKEQPERARPPLPGEMPWLRGTAFEEIAPRTQPVSAARKLSDFQRLLIAVVAIVVCLGIITYLSK